MTSWEDASWDALLELQTAGHGLTWSPLAALGLIDDSMPTLDDSERDVRALLKHIGNTALGGGQLDLTHVHRTICSKQRDYGHGNILKFGLTGVVVRLSDKVERLKNLFGNEAAPANESVADTWLDIVGYCAIGMMLCDDTFSLQLQGLVAG